MVHSNPLYHDMRFKKFLESKMIDLQVDKQDLVNVIENMKKLRKDFYSIYNRKLMPLWRDRREPVGDKRYGVYFGDISFSDRHDKDYVVKVAGGIGMNSTTIAEADLEGYIDVNLQYLEKEVNDEFLDHWFAQLSYAIYHELVHFADPKLQKNLQSVAKNTAATTDADKWHQYLMLPWEFDAHTSDFCRLLYRLALALQNPEQLSIEAEKLRSWLSNPDPEKFMVFGLKLPERMQFYLKNNTRMRHGKMLKSGKPLPSSPRFSQKKMLLFRLYDIYKRITDLLKNRKEA